MQYYQLMSFIVLCKSRMQENEWALSKGIGKKSTKRSRFTHGVIFKPLLGETCLESYKGILIQVTRFLGKAHGGKIKRGERWCFVVVTIYTREETKAEIYFILSWEAFDKLQFLYLNFHNAKYCAITALHEMLFCNKPKCKLLFAKVRKQMSQTVQIPTNIIGITNFCLKTKVFPCLKMQRNYSRRRDDRAWWLAPSL